MRQRHNQRPDRPPRRRSLRLRSRESQSMAAQAWVLHPVSIGPATCPAERLRNSLEWQIKHAALTSWSGRVCPDIENLPDAKPSSCLVCCTPWPCTSAQQQLAARQAWTRRAVLNIVLAWTCAAPHTGGAPPRRTRENADLVSPARPGRKACSITGHPCAVRRARGPLHQPTTGGVK